MNRAIKKIKTNHVRKSLSGYKKRPEYTYIPQKITMNMEDKMILTLFLFTIIDLLHIDSQSVALGGEVGIEEASNL